MKKKKKKKITERRKIKERKKIYKDIKNKERRKRKNVINIDIKKERKKERKNTEDGAVVFKELDQLNIIAINTLQIQRKMILRKKLGSLKELIVT